MIVVFRLECFEQLVDMLVGHWQERVEAILLSLWVAASHQPHRVAECTAHGRQAIGLTA